MSEGLEIVLYEDGPNRSRQKADKTRLGPKAGIIDAEFESVEVEEEAVALGRSAAETVLSKAGRQKTSRYLERVRTALTLSTPPEDWRVVSNVCQIQPPEGSNEDEEPFRNLLRRALIFVHQGETDVLGSEHSKDSGLKLRMQDQGFRKGFEDYIHEESPFKDERPEDRPWYLKPMPLFTEVS